MLSSKKTARQFCRWALIFFASVFLIVDDRAEAVSKPALVIWDAESPAEFVLSAYFAAIGSFPMIDDPALPTWIEMAGDQKRRPDVWQQILRTPAYLSSANARSPRQSGVCRRTQPNRKHGIFGVSEYYCHQLNPRGASCYPVEEQSGAPIRNITRNHALAMIAWYNINSCITNSWFGGRDLCKKGCGTTWQERLPHGIEALKRRAAAQTAFLKNGTRPPAQSTGSRRVRPSGYSVINCERFVGVCIVAALGMETRRARLGVREASIYCRDFGFGNARQVNYVQKSTHRIEMHCYKK